MDQNNLFRLLDIEDDGSIDIDEIHQQDNTITVCISRKPSITFCPICGNRMHSRGCKKRTVNHPILQNGNHLILKVSQRRWRCDNCHKEMNESFPFLARYAHYSTITPYLILQAMKNLNRSNVDIAKQFNMSDSSVHDLFSRYVDLRRLPLPSIISIDEVYLDIDDCNLYAFVIMDFQSGEIVDIVHNRHSDTLSYYFYSIDIVERKQVKAVISDAYGPYQFICQRYLPNACAVLDSFHVVKFINQKLNGYINEVLGRYRKKQREKLKETNQQRNREYTHIKDSEEIILLRDYRWLMLKNNDDLFYSFKKHYQKKLGIYLDTYDLERKFMALDKNFMKLRDLKEMYIHFNESAEANETLQAEKLDELIKVYRDSGFILFEEVASFLQEFRENIIASFSTVQCIRKTKKDTSAYYARLSNGPMESFNRKPKDFKRNARGFSNFDYTRNRILWATRTNPPMLAIPKPLDQIHSYHKRKKK